MPESLFLIKLQAESLQKRLWHRCFPVSFLKFLRTPFLQNTSGRLLLPLFNKTTKSSDSVLVFERENVWDKSKESLSSILCHSESKSESGCSNKINPLMHNVPKWSDTL